MGQVVRRGGWVTLSPNKVHTLKGGTLRPVCWGGCCAKPLSSGSDMGRHKSAGFRDPPGSLLQTSSKLERAWRFVHRARSTGGSSLVTQTRGHRRQRIRIRKSSASTSVVV